MLDSDLKWQHLKEQTFRGIAFGGSVFTGSNNLGQVTQAAMLKITFLFKKALIEIGISFNLDVVSSFQSPAQNQMDCKVGTYRI